MTEPLIISFVTTAYNEEKSLYELYQRCRVACAELQEELAHARLIQCRFVVADNASIDNTLSILKLISDGDPSVKVISNHRNYGPEASAVNALSHAGNYDFCILICSDLQDPPELVIPMARKLLCSPSHDAILAVKSKSSGSPMTRIARRSYYRVLGYTSRLQHVPNGFHGFGCYRREVISEALRYWDHTDLNLRQCLVKGSQSAVHISYIQDDRSSGKSSYGRWGYFWEAARSLISGDAAASRLAFLIGCIGLVLAIAVGVVLLINFVGRTSGYSSDTPALVALVLISFALQLLMFALLSRQLEALRMGGLRPMVRFSVYGEICDPDSSA